jgi:4-amino-4-deoxy-L-arabinose transferase-like glycosyltransferase
MIAQVTQFLREHKSWIILAGILLLAAFLRLYRIADYMTFLGDEGRDVLAVKHILDGHITLLGPHSSAADFYYGPIYFYMIAPFLWLFRLDPVGPAVFIALLGIVTVWLVYFVGNKFFGAKAGLTAAALYTVSPVVIAYSRSSWNPNPLPFVALLTFFVLYLALIKPRWWKFGLVGFLLGIAIQLQYIALFLIAGISIYALVGTISTLGKKFILPLFQRWGLIFVGFLVGWSPFLAFEVHHNFPNLRTIFYFLLGKYDMNVPVHTTPFEQVHQAFFMLFGRLVTRFPQITVAHVQEKPETYAWYLATMLLGLVAVVVIWKIQDRLIKLFFLCWLIFGVGLFWFYKKDIYDYYLGFMFPLPFLLLGNVLRLPFTEKKLSVAKPLVVLLFLVLFTINLAGLPFRYEPNRQKQQVETISKFVLGKTNNKPFNFALITPGNSDHAYRYYFEILHHSPITIQNSVVDPERKTVTDQLLVVCEDIHCQPLGNPLFEVAGFGRAEIAGEWDVSVVKVYKLVHYHEK